MYTRIYLCGGLLLCLILPYAAFAQENRLGQAADGPGADPFKIGIGRTFSASGAGTRTTGKDLAKKNVLSADFEEALKVIRQNYVSDRQTNPAVLTASAISSMLKMLDPHSSYFDPTDFQEMLDEHASAYSGTGSSIAAFERGGVVDTFVVSTLPDSPASRAGLRFGDKILSVDGRPATGLPLDAVREMLRGKPSTSARVIIEPAGGAGAKAVGIRRERLREPAVPAGISLKGDVGHIDLTKGFSNSTAAEFDSALNDLKLRGARSLVLDMRGNGGGILDQAIKIAEKFLPAGSLIVSQRGRYPAEDREWRSANTRYESMPLVLLVDEQSASATEVLAGALQDNDRALIVGRRTFGKGLVQSVLPLPGGAGLTLTAARYYTPAGRSIQRDYAETGLYDYYQHKKGEVDIDKPQYAARTLTKRVVYGGDGITPDETSDAGTFTPRRVRFLDPVFFFVRDKAGSNPAKEGVSPARGLSEVRRRILFQESTVDDTTLTDFEYFLDSDPKWKTLRPFVPAEKDFIRGMLAYYLALAAFGSDAAKQAKIESDPLVLSAINALPRSAKLAGEARKIGPSKEKSSLSLVLNEQR